MTSKEERQKAAKIIRDAMTSQPPAAEKESPEDQVLLRMQQAMRDIARPSNPGKRRERKVTRFVTKGNQAALRQTNNYVRSVYTTTDEAQRTFINVTERISTREVGPGDRYNCAIDCHGKDTSSREP